jgi:hypothetical protein
MAHAVAEFAGSLPEHSRASSGIVRAMTNDTKERTVTTMSPDPYDNVQCEIAGLLSEQEDLRRRYMANKAKLDRHRVKCPTCRCRILPGETCRCCAENTEDAVTRG